jgi:hypothetical protein
LTEFNVFANETMTSDLDYNKRTKLITRIQETINEPILGDEIIDILNTGNVLNLYNNTIDYNNNSNQEVRTPQILQSSTASLGIIAAIQSTPVISQIGLFAQNVLPGSIMSKLLSPFFQSNQDITKRNIDIANKETIAGVALDTFEANIVSKRILQDFSDEADKILDTALKQQKISTPAKLMRFFKLNGYQKFYEEIGELGMFIGSTKDNEAMSIKDIGLTENADFDYAKMIIHDFSTTQYNKEKSISNNLQLAFTSTIIQENGYVKLETLHGDLIIGKSPIGTIIPLRFNYNKVEKIQILSNALKKSSKVVKPESEELMLKEVASINERLKEITNITQATRKDINKDSTEFDGEIAILKAKLNELSEFAKVIEKHNTLLDELNKLIDLQQDLKSKFIEVIGSDIAASSLLEKVNQITSINHITYAIPRDGDYKGTQLKKYVSDKFINAKYSQAQIDAARQMRELLNKLGTKLQQQGKIIGINNTFFPNSYSNYNKIEKLTDDKSPLNIFGGYNQATTKDKFDKTKGIVNLNIATSLQSVFNRNQKRLETSIILQSLEMEG